MAEAHQAVAFQFVVTDEGQWAFRYDVSAVKSILYIFAKQYKRRYLMLRNRLLKTAFPASPLSLLVIAALLFLGSAFGYDLSFGIVSLWESVLFFLPRVLPYLAWQCIVHLLSALSAWYFLSYVLRKTLKLLLTYQGWMFERNRVMSLKTKVWALAVKLVSGQLFFRPMLFSYQMSLPNLPLPSVKDTLTRYLRSVRPLLNDEEYQEVEKLAEEFKNGPGKKLQFYLYLKTWWANNYVTDWWEKYVYLYGRNSIMINSNYYACDGNSKKTSNPAARAGVVLHSLILLKKDIERETLRPLVVRDTVPLCSVQYERLFGTTRIPGKPVDTLHHVSGSTSNYVVLYKKGVYYKIPLYHKGRPMTPAELQRQVQYIIDDDAVAGPGEEKLPAMTAENRNTWANLFDKHFRTGLNGQTMMTIIKAAGFFVMEDGEPELHTSGKDTEGLSRYCASLIHGNGYNRWFDKSLTCVFFKNGNLGLNAEHSWADAPIVGYLLEYCSAIEWSEGTYVNGQAGGTVEVGIPPPTQLKWDIPSEAVEVIDRAVVTAQESITDLDLYVMAHTDFGKGIMKKFKMSPDAFIQIALQLAYYRDAGKFSLTYEASMTRLFVAGRTETVRSCTVESAAFVKAMEDPNSTNKERLALLRAATDYHQSLYMDAMVGKGVDRHLFCLYVLSRYLELESPFLDKVLGEPWRLSTSQTPPHQTGRLDYNAEPWRIACGGGFGPVVRDGYGVSYIFPGDYLLYFHISSFKSSPVTDSRRFAQRIAQSLSDLKALCESQ